MFGDPVDLGNLPTDLGPLRGLLEQQATDQRANAAASKWRTILSSAPDADPDVVQTLMELDRRRVAAGQAPYDASQTGIMMAQARTPNWVLPTPKRSLWSRGIQDIRSMALGIPHVIPNILHQIMHAGEIPGDIAEAMHAPGLGNKIAGVLNAPIVQLMPGAFTVGALAGGHPEQLAEHPLFAGLDVANMGTLAAGAVLHKTPRQLATEGVARLTGAMERARPEWGAPLERLTGWLPGGGFTPTVRGGMTQLGITNRLLSGAQQRFEARGLAPLLKEAGLGTQSAIEEFSRQVTTPQTPADVFRAGLTPEQRAVWDFTQRENERVARVYEKQGLMVHHEGEWYSAKDNPALTNRVLKLSDLTDQIAEARRMGNQDLATKLTEEQARTQGEVSDLVAAKTPGRWVPLVQQQGLDAVRNFIHSNANPDDAGRLLDLVNQGFAERTIGQVAGLDRKTFDELRNDMSTTWQDMKARGQDPLFLGTVGPRRESSLASQIVPEGTRTPSVTRERSLWDGEATIPNLQLSLRHQHLEYLKKQFSGYAFERFKEQGLAIPGADAVKRSEDAALAAVARKQQAGRPILPNEARMLADKILHRDWVRYNPEAILPFSSPRMREFASTEEGTYYLPSALAHAMETMRKTPGMFTEVSRGATNVFRASVLALSPRYYLANAIGDTIAAVARTDLAEPAYYAKAFRTMQQGLVDPKLPKGLADISPELRTSGFRFGQKVSDWVYEHTPPALQGKSIWTMSEWVNDMTRLAAYLHQYDKELMRVDPGATRILGAETEAQRVARTQATAQKYREAEPGTIPNARRAARNFALQQSYRIFQNWDAMTPIERTSIRAVVPFYGFSKYIMRYVASYPFDHPIRTSILMNLARSELSDQPVREQLRNTVMLGHPDAKGNFSGLSTASWNPFDQAANLFTWGGLMAKTNPFIQTALARLGVDPYTATPQQFGLEQSYDPRLGRVVAQPAGGWGGFARAALGNFVPQAGSILNLIAPDKDVAKLRVLNPAAYQSSVLAGFGIPWTRRYNMTEERGREAVARWDALQKALAPNSGAQYDQSIMPLLYLLAQKKLGG